MTRKRLFSSAVPAAAVLAAAALLPGRAGAVTMSIDSTYVQTQNCYAYATSAETANSVGIKFRCPDNSGAGGNGRGVFAACDASGGDEFNAGTNAAGADGFADLLQPVCGNISNDPRIEFESFYRSGCNFSAASYRTQGPQTGQIGFNVCNTSVMLCGAIKYTDELSQNLTIDEMIFDVFKFQDDSNQNNEDKTPGVKTYFIDNPGTMQSGQTAVLPPVCVIFDGGVNIQGELGKTNGTYGYRVKAKTQYNSGSSGQITITCQRSYPSGTTLDGNVVAGVAAPQMVPQKPVTVDVTNVHVLTASATIVGRITGVQAQPYNFTYRLSKDATMYINIYNSVDFLPGVTPLPVRRLVPGLPRLGEGTPKGTLLNGEFWNGRADNGDLAPPGVYLTTFEGFTMDQFGWDISWQTTRQIGLDPVHITDIRTNPLMAGSTSLATLSYVLTEPATVYIDIYPPNTQFCQGLNNVNSPALDQWIDPNAPPKNFLPTLGTACPGATATPLRRMVESKMSRMEVVSFWDGMDRFGNALPDGEYVVVMYASVGSQNGYAFCTAGASCVGSPQDKRIWTSLAKITTLPIVRGYVGITQVTPASTVVGSSPPVAGINPFYFKYTLSREGVVNLKIFDASGTRLVKTLVQNELRPGLFVNQELWYDAAGDNGLMVTSGTYLVQLTAADTMFPAKVSTTTALFPVDLFRITDVVSSPLLSGASDVVMLNYQLSQTMNVAWNIYPPGTMIVLSSATWPPCLSITPAAGCAQILKEGSAVSPVITTRGLRVGRQKYTETWDGRDSNGLFVQDGNYFFTLTAESTQTVGVGANARYFASDKVMGNISVARGAIVFTSFDVKPEIPTMHNSSNTIELHPYTVEYGLTRQSSVTIQVLTSLVPATVVRTVVAGQVRDNGILLQDTWDGRDDRGNFPRAGFYNVRATAEDLASVMSSGATQQLTITYDPLRIYDVAVAPLRADSPSAIIAYQVSEPMKVSLKIFKPGTSFDAAGNPSPAESLSLVKRIVGIRPARTMIEESWNGTDLKQGIVPDGNYKFKLVASTDTAAIDTITGNVLNSSALASDRPVDDIPVARLGSADPFADFQTNTYIYPNPVSGSVGKVRIYVPFQGRPLLKVYTMSGELVLDRDFGERPMDTYVEYDWYKTNTSGRPLARGMYWAVFRCEETIGGRNIVQAVKKILIP